MWPACWFLLHACSTLLQQDTCSRGAPHLARVPVEEQPKVKQAGAAGLTVHQEVLLLHVPSARPAGASCRAAHTITIADETDRTRCVAHACISEASLLLLLLLLLVLLLLLLQDEMVAGRLMFMRWFNVEKNVEPPYEPQPTCNHLILTTRQTCQAPWCRMAATADLVVLCRLATQQSPHQTHRPATQPPFSLPPLRSASPAANSGGPLLT